MLFKSLGGESIKWGISDTAKTNVLHFETTISDIEKHEGCNLRLCFDQNTNDLYYGCRFAICLKSSYPSNVNVAIFEFTYKHETDAASPLHRELTQLSYIQCSNSIDPGFNYDYTARSPQMFFGNTTERTLCIYSSSGKAVILFLNYLYTKEGELSINLQKTSSSENQTYDGYIFRDLKHYWKGNEYYQLDINYLRHEATSTLIKTLNTDNLIHSDYSGNYLNMGAVHYYTNQGENYLIAVLGHSRYGNIARYAVYEMNIENQTSFTEKYSAYLSSSNGYGEYTGYALNISADERAASINLASTNNTSDNNASNILNTQIDYQNVIALLYDGEYYYRGASGLLSALPSDVREGCTFMGQNGYPETGTMEVEQ